MTKRLATRSEILVISVHPPFSRIVLVYTCYMYVQHMHMADVSRSLQSGTPTRTPVLTFVSSRYREYICRVFFVVSNSDTPGNTSIASLYYARWTYVCSSCDVIPTNYATCQGYYLLQWTICFWRQQQVPQSRFRRNVKNTIFRLNPWNPVCRLFENPILV